MRRFFGLGLIHYQDIPLLKSCLVLFQLELSFITRLQNFWMEPGTNPEPGCLRLSPARLMPGQDEIFRAKGRVQVRPY
jgi:hypothetical protein